MLNFSFDLDIIHFETFKYYVSNITNDLHRFPDVEKCF